MFNLHLVGFLETISGALCLKMSLTQFSPKWGFSPASKTAWHHGLF